VRLFTPSGSTSTVAVEDDGIGIPNGICENIFRYEIKTTTSGTAGEIGHGFGLPFSREIMEAHGGTLTVECENDFGCTFFAQLPYVKPKVLLVDDEPKIRFLYRSYLAKMELEIFEAENGEEALQMIETEKYHLIITDLSIPIMDGFVFMSHLKSDPKTDNIPVIVLTSDSSLETRTKVLQMGADDFSSKMIKPNEFLPHVSRFLA
jgi:CheY-like chemotaxis protein